MFRFPFTNFHELNLDWVLSVVKEAKEVFDNGRSDIDYAVETADEAKEIAQQAAEATIPDNSITTPKIRDYAVTTDKIGTYAVTTDKIQEGGVTASKLAANAVTTAKINDGAVTNAKLADNAVTTIKILNGAVSTVKLADGAVTAAKLESSIAAAIGKINSFLSGAISLGDDVAEGTLDSTMLYKNGNTVFMAARVYNINITPYHVFFKIPPEFAPSRVVRVLGFCTSSNGTIPVLMNVLANGDVTLYLTQSYNVTIVGVCGCYTLL